MAVLEAGEKLSKQACDTTNVGEMLFVMDSSAAFVCDGKSWQTFKGEDGGKGDPGKDGDNGTGCTSKSVKNAAGLEGLEVTCGETVIDTIWNGKDGKDGEDGNNGTSCTAKSVKNKSGLEGLEVTCGETVIDTVWNGKDGKDGEDGDNGTSCTAKSVKNKSGLEGLEVTCGETVVDTIWNGKDGQNGNNGTSCTAKSVKNKSGLEGLEVTCGETVIDTVWNGKNGENGNNGTSCTAKSVKNKSGLEGLEVTCGETVIDTVWNGKNGENGNNGTSCTAEPVKNAAGLKGLEVTCGETVIDTVWNGKDGQNGNNGTSCIAEPVKNAAGLKGLEVTCGETVVDTIWNGKDGQNGNNGTSCTATVNQDGGFDLVCDGQTVGTITNGEDGVGCTLDDEGDGRVTVSCGKGSAMTTTILYKAVCGAKPYDPAKSFCSDDELFSCDDKPYDPKKQYCLKVTRDETDIYSVEDLLTDARDEEHVQVYKTVEICNNETSTCQIWMAENLNYSVNSGEQSWCGGGSGTTEGDCSVYGRLYTWAAAVGKSEDECGCDHECDLSGAKNEKGEVRGICPEGWHLPSNDEWNALFTAVGGTSYAGQKLKADSDLWTQEDGISNDDSFGFAVLPAGYRSNYGSFRNEGNYARFWSSTEFDSGRADYWYFYYFSVYYDWDNKYNGFSVRCLRD